MDIRELLRHMRNTPSDRAVQCATGVHRKTVKQYREWAQEHNLLSGPLPATDELQALVKKTLGNPSQPPQNISSVEIYRDIVAQLHKEKVEVMAIYQRLKERGYQGSYSSVLRFVRKIDPRPPQATVRVERKPAEEAQVDFGFAGHMIEPGTGQFRKTWAFVMTLSWSRHQFVRFVFDQRVETWLDCHRRAFQFFDGVPERVVIDNLKAAIIRACWDDPEVCQAYRECAEHYGFLISPCRPGTPEHKGKVEQGGVHYLKRNFLGGRRPTLISQSNQEVLVWCNTTAGQRVHGTTKGRPLVRFEQVEQARLKPLPEAAYDLAIWKVVKVHRDCHIVFDKAYYSTPFRLIGQQLRVRGGCSRVCLYTLDYEVVASHPRATHAGKRQTNHLHLPPHKLPGLTLDRTACRTIATNIGPVTLEVVNTLLDDPVVDRLRTVGRLLKLRDRYGDERLEAACVRAVRFDDLQYVTIKRILDKELDQSPLPTTPVSPPAHTFVRSATELVGHLFGDETWN